MKGKSGKQMAVENFEKFKKWITERDTVGDWTDYVFQGQIQRQVLAKECAFATSVLRQNPAVRQELKTLEARLRDQCILKPSRDAGDAFEADKEVAEAEEVVQRTKEAKARTEKRLKTLEERNAALLEEVRNLKEQLKREKIFNQHLEETGRMIRP